MPELGSFMTDLGKAAELEAREVWDANCAKGANPSVRTKAMIAQAHDCEWLED
jgi:hypothetical protein